MESMEEMKDDDKQKPQQQHQGSELHDQKDNSHIKSPPADSTSLSTVFDVVDKAETLSSLAQDEQKQNHRNQQKTENLNPQDILHYQQLQQKNRSYHHHSSTQQPEGWRVKLYRLNIDGSWDDCGTGRIIILYRSLKNPNKKLQSPPTHVSGADSTSILMEVDQWLYQETGEATLCVHAEVAQQQLNPLLNTTGSKNNAVSELSTSELISTHRSTPDSVNIRTQQPDSQTQPHVLLRTRILLQDAYQRQGDNIITWCEPYCAPTQKHNSLTGNGINDGSSANNKGTYSVNENDRSNSGSKDGGVDLALSFQDNAGCLDIWRQITQVQGMAAFLLRQRQQQPPPHQGNAGATSVEDMAAQAAANHHANLQREQQDKNSNLWDRQQQRTVLYRPQHTLYTNNLDDDGRSEPMQDEYDSSDLNYMNDGLSNIRNGMMAQHPQSFIQQQWLLPPKPTLENLGDIGDVIAGFQHAAQQRETLVTWMIAEDCLYLKNLLNLLPAAEDKGDYRKLATLAACVKCILLLNDSSILEWIVNDSVIFEKVCSCLEYDPDLREKANHRWFLRERAKFRTVVPMEDPNLIALIHRSFRITYMRDTLLRPTMDESSLSTLSSLLTFTHNEVVKLVATSRGDNNVNYSHPPVLDRNNMDQNCEFIEILKGSYMLRVMRLLGVECHILASMEWSALQLTGVSSRNSKAQENVETPNIEDTKQDNSEMHRSDIYVGNANCVASIELDHSIVMPNLEESTNSTKWRQYLSPQDGSLESRSMRRRGCIGFLRELFSMVRMSLQQCDKDDFFPAVCSMEIELIPSSPENLGAAMTDTLDHKHDTPDTTSNCVSQICHIEEVGTVITARTSEDGNEKAAGLVKSPNLVSRCSAENGFMPAKTTFLSILADCLSDPKLDNSEKGNILEIVRGITLQDPGLIRRHCIVAYRSKKRERNPLYADRIETDIKKQVAFICPPGDLLASLFFLLGIETDAGILLQVSEVLRFVLDTDMLSDTGNVDSGNAASAGTSYDEQLDHDNFADNNERSHVNHNPGGAHDSHNDSNQIRIHEQKLFLSIFYEYYIEWLVVQYHFTILCPKCQIPRSVSVHTESLGPQYPVVAADDTDVYFEIVPFCAIRSAFAVDTISFCVRAHSHRMKLFLLKTQTVRHILDLLKSSQPIRKIQIAVGANSRAAGDRCLKLAIFRFLRTLLSEKDEKYYRHIIDNDIFQQVFDAFRSNPVGDNLLSSTIIEICDFIHAEKITTLIEHIVTKHLTAPALASSNKIGYMSLEYVSGRYVSTLKNLRRDYEDSLKKHNDNDLQQNIIQRKMNDIRSSRFFSGDEGTVPCNLTSTAPIHHPERQLTGRALADQRRFRESDEEESYFDS